MSKTIDEMPYIVHEMEGAPYLKRYNAAVKIYNRFLVPFPFPFTRQSKTVKRSDRSSLRRGLKLSQWCLRRAERYVDMDAETILLVSGLNFALGNYRQAQTVMERLSRRNDNFAIMAAACALRASNKTAVLRLARQAYRSDRTSQRSNIYFVLALLLNNKLRAAQQQLKSLQKVAPRKANTIKQYLQLVENGEWKLARSTAQLEKQLHTLGLFL